MARRKWVERDHPRHPAGEQGGRFRDRVGSGGWAAKVASAIGTRRGRGSRIVDSGGGGDLRDQQAQGIAQARGGFDGLSDDPSQPGAKRLSAGALAEPDVVSQYADSDEYEVYDPEFDAWGALQDAYEDSQHSSDGSMYIEVVGDGVHFTVDPDGVVLIRRKNNGNDEADERFRRELADEMNAEFSGEDELADGFARDDQNMRDEVNRALAPRNNRRRY